MAKSAAFRCKAALFWAAAGLGKQRSRHLAVCFGAAHVPACAPASSHCLPAWLPCTLLPPHPTPAEKTTCNVRVNIQKILGQGDRNPASQGYNAAL